MASFGTSGCSTDCGSGCIAGSGAGAAMDVTTSDTGSSVYVTSVRYAHDIPGLKEFVNARGFHPPLAFAIGLLSLARYL